MAIRLALAADEDLTLLGAKVVLEREYRYRVVGTARKFSDLWRLVTEKKPDVVIINDWLGGMHAAAISEKLKRHNRRLKVIVMSGVSDGLFIHDLFTAGINGYLHKSDALADCLASAVDTVMADFPYLSPFARNAYIIAMQAPDRNNRITAESLHVLNLLARGNPVGKIAFELDVPIRRVYWVRDKLRHRFDATTNEHLIYCAMAQGLI